MVISSLRLFFSSRYFCSLSLPSLSVFSPPRDEHSPIPLYSAKDTSNDDDDDRQTQTDRQTNKQTHHAALRDMVRAQNGHTLFRFFFYILSTASLVKIGGGSVLISLSLFSSLSLSLSSKGGKYEDEEDAKRGEFAPSPSRVCVCVCVCVCVRLRI